MKKSVFCFLVFIQLYSFSQNNEIDSLQKVLSKIPTEHSIQSDTNKANILNKIAFAYIGERSLEKAEKCAIEARELARNHNHKEGEANSYYILGVICKHQYFHKKSLINFLNSLKLSSEIGDNEGMSNVYNEMGTIYVREANYDNAINSYIKSLNLRRGLGYKKGVANSLFGLGNVYNQKGDYKNALKNYFEALKINEEIGGKLDAANLFFCIGIVYLHQGDYSKALEQFLKASNMMKKLNNKQGLAASFEYIGSVHHAQGNLDKALEYYLLSLKTMIELENKIGIASSYDNIGRVFCEKENYVKALENHLNSLKVSKEIGDIQKIGVSYTSIGFDYMKLGDSNPLRPDYYEAALKNYNVGLDTLKSIGNKIGTAEVLNNIGNLYLKRNELDKSIYYFNQSLALSQEMRAKKSIKDSYLLLNELYEKKQDYKQAYKYFKLYSNIKDTLYNEKSSEQIAEMNAKYETEKKEHEIELLNQDKQLKAAQFQSELQQQKKRQKFLTIVSVLLVLLVIVITISYKEKIKSNALITLKNEEIAIQEAAIRGQTAERNRIAKELHDGIGGTLAGIKLSLIGIDSSSETNTNLKSVINNIDSACKEVRTISHNLVSPAFSNSDVFIEIMKNTIQKFIFPNKTAIHFDYFPEEELNRIPKNIQEAIHRIVQEALHNISKHANASSVEIGLSLQDNSIHLIVEDNGKGFDATVVNSGIGLKNMEARVKILKGNIIIDSKLNRGTAITIEFPLTNHVAV